MNQTRSNFLMCDNPECSNFGYNLLMTDPNEWEPCCERITTLYDQALIKLDYDPAEFYRKTYAELDELYQDDAPETVQLIAAGYDWTCPACNQEHCMVEEARTVICDSCGREYLTETTHPTG